MANEKRLIDADALKEKLWFLFKWFGQLPCSEEDKRTQQTIKKCIAEVDKIPTVDAVEVVRCKDCKHFTCRHIDRGACELEKKATGTSAVWYISDFCSYGERREGE